LEEIVDTTEEEEEIAEDMDELALKLECAEDELEEKDSNFDMELEDGEFEKLRVEDEDNFELLGDDGEELSDLDEEVESSEQDDELLSIPIEDEELIDDVKEEENSDELAMLLLHTSTVLQTSTS